MTPENFAYKLQRLVHEANAAQVPLEDMYHAVHGQDLLLETLLKLEIEKAYKERYE